jgi:hypothetical protein
MDKLKFTILTLLFTTLLSAQQLESKSRGRVFDANNKKLSPSEVRRILTDEPEALSLYKSGRRKKTIGNLLIVTGAACIVANYINYTFQEYDFHDPYSNEPPTAKKKFPSALGIAGAAALLIAIPVKMNFNYNIEKAIEKHNGKIALNSKPTIEQIAVCANADGLGLQIIF